MKCEVCGGPLMGDHFDHKPGCFMGPPLACPLCGSSNTFCSKDRWPELALHTHHCNACGNRWGEADAD